MSGDGGARARRYVSLTSILGILLSLFAPGCESYVLKRRLVHSPPVAFTGKRPTFLKAHLRNGEVYVFSEWRVDETRGIVWGIGDRFDANRVKLSSGQLSVELDSVAIFETNSTDTSPAVAALTVVTGASLALTVFCMANPKACFGSCPTFYLSDNETGVPQAEGFSASIAPAFEATDVDALYGAMPTSRVFDIRMTNEALETHVVRRVDLLAAPRPEGGRIVATGDGRYLQAIGLSEPVSCHGPEGDFVASVRAFDGVERYSTTDSADLAAKETVSIEFADVPEGELGLVIASRQTLLTTYLLYQALAYMGGSAGWWFAELERGSADVRGCARGIGQLMGGIEVLVVECHDVVTTQAEEVDDGHAVETTAPRVPAVCVPRLLCGVRSTTACRTFAGARGEDNVMTHHI